MKPLEDMTAHDALTHIQDLRARLRAKRARERAYLDRRAARGTRTPTDEAYESDQKLEDELIAVLDNLESGLLQEVASEL